MLKYFYKNSLWAIEDFNERIESLADMMLSKRKVETHNFLKTINFKFLDKGSLIENTTRKFSTFTVEEFPQIIYPNWLYDIVNYSEPLTISQFISPIDSSKALAGLRNRITNLSAMYYERTEKGKIHTIDLEQAIRDARNIEDEIVRGSEKLYEMSMFLGIDSNSENKLSQKSKSLLDLAYAKQIKLHSNSYIQKSGMESLLPAGNDKVKSPFALTSSNISSSLPFTTATLNEQGGIFYGITTEGTKVRFNRFANSSKNFNGIIFATSGAGKSFAAKLEAYRNLFNGISVFVIDPEGEFRKLCDEVGGTNIEINPESKIKVNPLEFISHSDNTESKEVMRTHLGVVKGLLKIWLSDETYNRGVISKVVNQTYANKGILLDDPTTYSKEPPTISDLIEEFRKEGFLDIERELIEYSRNGELGDLYDNQTSLEVDFDAPMVVFNIQKVPSHEKQASIYYLSNFIWQKVLANRKKKILIIDEAHLLLKNKSSADFMENLVRRGRKYNLGVISISQDVDDFLKSPQGSVIAKNAETALLLSQKKQSIPSVVKAFELSSAEQEYITRLTKGQALFIKGNINSHIYIYPTPHEIKLFSSNAVDLENYGN